MNWESISALAELLGAIGVIASLLYVAAQIRQNTRATRAASAREAAYRYADWNKQVCSNEEFGKLYDIMLQDSAPDFSESEWNKMSAFIKALFHIYEAQ